MSRTPSERGRASRAKGHTWERECARALTEAVGQECKRNLSETREGNLGDIQMPEAFGVAVQCKVGDNPPIYAAVEEAVEAQLKHGHGNSRRISVALIRRNAKPGRKRADLAVLPVDDFYAILDWLSRYGFFP